MSQSETGQSAHTFDIKISPETYRAFVKYDVFVRLRRWVPMASFAGIMTAFAILCFALQSIREQAALLGVVLLVVGLGLPGIILQQFFSSVNKQIKKLGLTEPKDVYTLTLPPAPGLFQVVTIRGETETFAWADMYGAYRNQSATYLYVNSTKAYMMPDECVESPSELWQFLGGQLPPEKLHPRK